MKNHYHHKNSHWDIRKFRYSITGCGECWICTHVGCEKKLHLSVFIVQWLQRENPRTAPEKKCSKTFVCIIQELRCSPERSSITSQSPTHEAAGGSVGDTSPTTSRLRVNNTHHLNSSSSLSPLRSNRRVYASSPSLTKPSSRIRHVHTL